MDQVLEHSAKVQQIMMKNEMVIIEEGHVHKSDIKVQIEHVANSQGKIQ